MVRATNLARVRDLDIELFDDLELALERCTGRWLVDALLGSGFTTESKAYITNTANVDAGMGSLGSAAVSGAVRNSFATLGLVIRIRNSLNA